ncbi:MAG: MOSC domain-containing protein [Thermoplasmata archaeon]|nr:MOSC domain-containing protein [Thermoplasmata archaeon]
MTAEPRNDPPIRRLVSINVGRVAPMTFRERTIQTAFRKSSVSGPVEVLADHLEGDEVGDPRVHGGPKKSVYAYPMEHYAYWRPILPNDPLPWGSFGENLNTEGIFENELRPGDVLAIGTAVLVVVQPRGPCYKLGLRFQDDSVVDKFLESGRSGIYLGVQRPGTITAGDAIRYQPVPTGGPTISDLFQLKVAAARS